MEVTIKRTILLKALGHVQSVVERRNITPILSNVLLQAEGGALVLTTTDLDIEVSEQVPADVTQAGAVTTSAVTLYEIVRRLPEGAQVRLTLEEGGARDSLLAFLKLSAGRSEFSLAVLPDRDFPSLSSQEDTGISFTLATLDMKRLIDKTRFAMSQEEARYYLNGIYLHATSDSLRAVATDGHRLARVDVALPAGAEDIPEVIIPRKAIRELRRLLDDADDMVDVRVAGTKVRFSFSDVIFVTKLVAGTFPDYNRVIPTGNDVRVRLASQEFAQAVDRVSTVSADKTRPIKLSLEQDHLRLLVDNSETGSAQEEISVTYGAEPMVIGFNARYLQDITKEIDGDDLCMDLNDPASPCVMRDPEDEDVLYVLMPMRL